MYKVSVDKSISAAHQLPRYPGKCSNLHGHNWRIRVTVVASSLDDQGMVVDFSLLKKALGEVCELLDHKMLNEVPILNGNHPTAENLSKLFYDEVSRRLPNARVRLDRVEVWETPDNRAEYSPDGDGQSAGEEKA
ncbi:6-carboxytetrahydropterin synthase QueD [bacterium CG2_30_54_10]|nr:MAG: 6-carboxytetrahydropterin synthase QueD [bacterium CG2_30_54_10]